VPPREYHVKKLRDKRDNTKASETDGEVGKKKQINWVKGVAGDG